MKNVFSIVLVFGVLLTLTACGDKPTQPTVTTSTTAETLDTSVITDPPTTTTIDPTSTTTRFTKPTVIITTTKTTETHMQIPEYVSEKGALILALEHAGLTEADVQDVEIEYNRRHGRQVWEVDFEYQNFEYEYVIDAATHKVTSFAKNDIIHSIGIGWASETAIRCGITDDVALEKALTHAKLPEYQVSNVEVELDKDDGVYDVSFESGGFDYEYEIDAKIGAIVRFEKEPKD